MRLSPCFQLQKVVGPKKSMKSMKILPSATILLEVTLKDGTWSSVGRGWISDGNWSNFCIKLVFVLQQPVLSIIPRKKNPYKHLLGAWSISIFFPSVFIITWSNQSCNLFDEHQIKSLSFSFEFQPNSSSMRALARTWFHPSPSFRCFCITQVRAPLTLPKLSFFFFCRKTQGISTLIK